MAQPTEWLRGAVLGNSGNFCYSNSVFLALAMAITDHGTNGPVDRLLHKIKRA